MKRLIAYNLNINPTMVTAVPEYFYGESILTLSPRVRSFAKIQSEQINLNKKRKANIISPKSRRKINNATNWLVFAARKKKGLLSKHTGKYHQWKCNFITLTLRAEWKTSELNAVDFKRECVNAWLTYARTYFGLQNYIWKIERTKKGILHLHIASDKFILWRELRDSWNRILISKGYLDGYHKEHGHYDANSTDIHAQKKLIKDMAAYLCKEFQKNDPDGKMIEGRLWGCSQSLSRVCNQKVQLMCIDNLMNPIGSHEMTMLSKIIKKQREILTKPDSEGKQISLGMCFFPQPKDWLNEKLGVIQQTFIDAIQTLRGGVVQPELIFC